MSDLPPLPNEPVARTPDGTLKDATTASPPATPTSPNSGDQTTHEPAAKSTDANPEPGAKPDDQKPAGTPDKYDFKPPEGQTYDPKLLADAETVFRELGLTQAQANRLVELQAKTLAPKSAQDAIAMIKSQGDAWTAETMAAPDLGPKIEEHKITIARALGTVMSPSEKAAFIKFGDQTLFFNQPDVFRGLLKLATKVAPGTHVAGAGPSPNGQSANGTSQRPSIAESMYPRKAS